MEMHNQHKISYTAHPGTASAELFENDLDEEPIEDEFIGFTEYEWPVHFQTDWRSHAPSAGKKGLVTLLYLTSSLGMQLATLWSSWEVANP